MQDAIKQWGHKIPAEEVMSIMAAADVDGDGFIDYNEFVAATINVNQLEKEDLIYKAFQEFDEDGSNSISMDELEKVCVVPATAAAARIGRHPCFARLGLVFCVFWFHHART